MRKFIARKIGYPLQDYVTHTSIIKTIDALDKSQYWDANTIQQYQLNKIIRLVDYAVNNVPYYSSLFKKCKLDPSDIRQLTDLNKIPILSKEIARAENFKLISTTLDKKYIRKGKTGGTTGAPLITLKDTATRTFTWASYYRWYKWMGIDMGDPVATLWGTSSVLHISLFTNLKEWFANYIQNEITINSFDMSEETIPKIINKLNRFKPKLIKGYLSALLLLAMYMKKAPEKIDFKPLAVSTTTETLLPHHRLLLENAFGCKVFDQYGCGEVSGIAYECSAHRGLHINTEHVLVEIVDENGNEVKKGTGRLIVTDLDNLAMPTIRYDVGDLSSFGSMPCTCGVTQPMLQSIDGRAIDTLILSNGSKVHGVFITDIFYELGILSNTIQRFQVFQNKPGEIELRIESIAPLEKVIIDKLYNSLKHFFSHVAILHYDRLPMENNGKFKYIISKLDESMN